MLHRARPPRAGTGGRSLTGLRLTGTENRRPPPRPGTLPVLTDTFVGKSAELVDERGVIMVGLSEPDPHAGRQVSEPWRSRGVESLSGSGFDLMRTA